MINSYDAYIERLQELLARETEVIELISQCKGRFRKKKEAERAEEELTEIRAEAAKICAMLDNMRSREDEKMISVSYIDENPQEYNEVIGVCYGRVICLTDSGRLLYYDTEQPETVSVGDCELDDGALRPLDALPTGEQTLIVSYLIEAEETPIQYLNFLKEIKEK